MHTIMLAEDEPMILESIIHAMNWREFSFETPVGCRDGLEALKKMESGWRPDALIADVRMPYMDGLELIRRTAEISPKTVAVVLSGHEKFTYAQKALQMKVFDYVLKPVSVADLKALVLKLKNELDSRKTKSGTDPKALKRNFLRRLLEQENLGHELTFDESLLFQLTNQHHLVAMVDASSMKAESGLPLELLKNALSDLTDELAANSQALAYQAQNGVTRLIVSGMSPLECQEAAKRLVETIAEAARKQFCAEVSAGIGEPVCLSQLNSSFKQAEKALAFSFSQRENRILLYSFIKNEKLFSSFDFSSICKDFEKAVMMGDKDAVLLILRVIFSNLEASSATIERSAFCCQRLLLILHQSTDCGASLEQLREDLALGESSALGQLEMKMANLCVHSMKSIEPKQSSSAASQVAKAESYIRKRYKDPDLSLVAITKDLAVSVSYFSSVFKSLTSCTFVEYLTKVRIEKAKQLLSKTDLIVCEIAVEVGFEDPHYFSAVFKRFTGMSPKEFRQRCED